MMFSSIKTAEDITYFLNEINYLHDSYIIKVEYINDGISKIEQCLYFNTKQTKLVLKILVTSICDTVVEIEFDNIVEWQIKEHQWEITDTSVVFIEDNNIVWCDDIFESLEELKKGSYVIAKSMKWRVV